MKCMFCLKDLAIQMYSLKCDDCHMQYLAFQRPDWKYVQQSYQLNDPEYKCHSLVMDLENNTSTIWMYKVPHDGPNMYKISIPAIFPNTKPQDALKLTRQLINLKAFS